MFKKVLIANRGEIACRLIRTLNRMNICSVAVYSEADENVLHVEMADEAYLIGPAPVRESYLNIEAILEAAKKSGAEAIHPGYGFLSENPSFAEAVSREGLVFIGPSPKAIALMGDKLEAKKLAKKVGVSCLPGTDEPLADMEKTQKAAEDIGYPLMIKAAAGGGGKGMRIVRSSEDLYDALKGAIHEATTSFGDPRVFLEKYIDSSRHIEIQILADNYGNIIHLGERECSLQRRHQKVIEESPSPFVTPSLRDAMGKDAICLAQAVGYSSAGTVEFVVDEEKNFYFLEMNTRLQVEHPVTELTTGLDLVEEMIRIAANEPLRFQQSDIHFQGHAIEARIYAEDSTRGFLPSIGRIRTYLPPSEKEGEIRLESGVREGDLVTPYYDPLIAKLITHQSTRDLTSECLLKSLDCFYIRGIATNISFLSCLVHSPSFIKGEFNTRTLDECYNEGFTPSPPPDPFIAIGTAAAIYCIRNNLHKTDIAILIEKKAHFVSVFAESNQFEIQEGNKTLIIETSWKPGDPLFQGVFNGHDITIQVDFKGIRDDLFWNGYKAPVTVVTPKVAELIACLPINEKAEVSPIITAPMPGLIVEVSVKEGAPIKVGQPVTIIEAMKMENIIRSSCDGVIEKVYVKEGDSVNLDQHLAKIK